MLTSSLSQKYKSINQLYLPKSYVINNIKQFTNTISN